MNKNRFAKQVMVVAGFLFLCAGSPLTRAQNTPPAGMPPQQGAPSAAQPNNDAAHRDIFAGLTLTDEQKAKIEQIRHNTKARADAVVKDERLNPDQKDAMLQGLRRLGNSEIFGVLTPEQQKEVHRRMHELRAAQQPQKKPAPMPQ